MLQDYITATKYRPVAWKSILFTSPSKAERIQHVLAPKLSLFALRYFAHLHSVTTFPCPRSQRQTQLSLLSSRDCNYNHWIITLSIIWRLTFRNIPYEWEKREWVCVCVFYFFFWHFFCCILTVLQAKTTPSFSFAVRYLEPGCCFSLSVLTASQHTAWHAYSAAERGKEAYCEDDSPSYTGERLRTFLPSFLYEYIYHVFALSSILVSVK